MYFTFPIDSKYLQPNYLVILKGREGENTVKNGDTTTVHTLFPTLHTQWRINFFRAPVTNQAILQNISTKI